VVSKDREIGIGSKSETSWIGVEETGIRKRMKRDFLELGGCADCSGIMRIRRKRSGGEIFARRGKGDPSNVDRDGQKLGGEYRNRCRSGMETEIGWGG
jgi:hypothetical protein